MLAARLVTPRAGVAVPPPPTRRAQLLDLDPDLGRTLSPERCELARQRLTVRMVRLRQGPWPMSGSGEGGGMHLGLLVLEGILGRELLAADVASLELVGPGDLVRPWEEAADGHLLNAVVRWSALADTRFAVLDASVAAQLADFPEIYAELLERCAARSRRLGVTQAICQLNRVERRLLALLWHLAERWGRVTPEGVAVPLTLSHRLLAQLVGARRPTVSTSLAQLAHTGEVRRAADGTWLLTGEPIGAPVPALAHFVMPRRRMLAGGGSIGAAAS